MNEPGSSGDTHPGTERMTLVDGDIFLKLLMVASAAVVYRQQMETYQAQQAALVEQGTTVEEMVAGNWKLFEEVARAEQRLFEALDNLEDLQEASS